MEVLSRHNNQIEVTLAKLDFSLKVNQGFVRRILDYAISHNVQQLTVSCSCDYNEILFPLYLFSSQSLKHLTIAGKVYSHSIRVISTWELTTLTTLHLEFITFNDEVTNKCTGIFSKCANLKKLMLKQCSMTKSNGVEICHPGLSDLTLEYNNNNNNNIHNPAEAGYGEVNIDRAYPYLQAKPGSRETACKGPPASERVH
ncbi:F-box domain containing protein [Tanacetum coccineum]